MCLFCCVDVMLRVYVFISVIFYVFVYVPVVDDVTFRVMCWLRLVLFCVSHPWYLCCCVSVCVVYYGVWSARSTQQ